MQSFAIAESSFALVSGRGVRLLRIMQRNAGAGLGPHVRHGPARPLLAAQRITASAATAQPLPAGRPSQSYPRRPACTGWRTSLPATKGVQQEQSSPLPSMHALQREFVFLL